MKRKYIITAISAIILISISCFSSLPAQQDNDSSFEPQATQYVLWTCSDPHIRGDGGSYTCSPGAWSETIDDAFNRVGGVNYSICLGDFIEWDEVGPFPAAWDYFWNNTGYTYGWNDTYALTTWSNIVIGNHDGGWGLCLPNDRTVEGHWTYEMGNVLFIGINDSWSQQYSFDRLDGSSWGNRVEDYNFAWLNQTVQDNQNKNIILFCHAPIRNTTWESGGPNYAPYGNGHAGMYLFNDPTGCDPWGYGCGWPQNTANTNFTEWLNWLDNESMHLNAWVHGHTHSEGYELNCVEKHGTTFICDLKLSISGSSHTRESLFWYFEEGNKTVAVKAYNHGSKTWESTAYFPHDLDLTYDFTFNPEYNVTQFISIDGGLNQTVVYNSTPTFNWTSGSDIMQYHLQIATDSSFTMLVADISNINEINYPTKYNENATRVSFVLPSANALALYNNYYCRVRGLSK